MSKKDDKELLAKKKFNAIFESIQRKTAEKREKTTEAFRKRGMLESGMHARKMVDIELENIRNFLYSKLQIDTDVFYNRYKPHLAEDEIFLKGRISKLFHARFRASLQTIEDFHNKYGLPFVDAQKSYFHGNAYGILSGVSGIISKIETSVLENKISIKKWLEIDINTLLKREESNLLEFKSTFQWDVRQKKKNPDLRAGTINTIAAFNNTDGGDLLIGVEDNKNIFGLEKDYFLLKKQNKDGFLLLLTQEIGNKISKDFITKIKIQFHTINKKDICKIIVKFGDDAVWVKENKKSETFYIRTQNSTRSLSPREATEYIRKKWPHAK
jgi:hypothetical protein